MYTRVHAHMHIHIHIHIHIHVRLLMYLHVQPHTHTHNAPPLSTHTHMRSRTHMLVLGLSWPLRACGCFMFGTPVSHDVCGCLVRAAGGHYRREGHPRPLRLQGRSQWLCRPRLPLLRCPALLSLTTRPLPCSPLLCTKMAGVGNAGAVCVMCFFHALPTLPLLNMCVVVLYCIGTLMRAAGILICVKSLTPKYHSVLSPT
jgi:hypothetical protein